MRSVLIVDAETTGLDPETDTVVEIGCVLWSVEHRSMVETYSRVLPAPGNPAEAVNGIPAALCREANDVGAWVGLKELIGEADAVCAHQADFDRAFIEPHLSFVGVDWICTREDVRWPRAGTGTSLIATALAHGVAVTNAHRAIHDCLLLARLFEAVPTIDAVLADGLRRSRLPKRRWVARVTYDTNALAKERGFKWDPSRKQWWRVMNDEDAAELVASNPGFEVTKSD